ncbi:hypothetical protein ACP4OV_005658 [Aristida adscensionis]
MSPTPPRSPSAPGPSPTKATAPRPPPAAAIPSPAINRARSLRRRPSTTPPSMLSRLGFDGARRLSSDLSELLDEAKRRLMRDYDDGRRRAPPYISELRALVSEAEDALDRVEYDELRRDAEAAMPAARRLLMRLAYGSPLLRRLATARKVRRVTVKLDKQLKKVNALEEAARRRVRQAAAQIPYWYERI